ncbi:two-component system sensor histidine kinase NtrB [Isoalcanivorax indicus]|uniref:two-component system sensor histidine kinase NtrB n=1 Tax=Isoalcanivorax indicus TaxID=2202653 RepID=UPI001FE2B67B|nr:HAMP domain-containing sensor histidine kinase [Isoalcanivorax indicus]
MIEGTRSVEDTQLWTPIRVYTGYRVLLALLLLTLYMAAEPPLVGQHSPTLFLYTAAAYVALTIMSLVMKAPLYRGRRLTPVIPVISDIVILTLMIHASGGIESSLTVLLLVTVAAASIILPGRLGLLTAALATFAVMFEQVYFALDAGASNPFQVTEAGTLGLAFFAVALITHQVAQRLARSEQLARTQHEAIRRLQSLNHQVVERMRTGILVFSDTLTVELCNRSAQEFFPAARHGAPLPDALASHFRDWQTAPHQTLPPLPGSHERPDLDARFAPLDGGNAEGPDYNIVFLEDRARLMQEVQQLKLASLGRMSATIAHEIRNPLSAINHAAQLLEEGIQQDEDRKLLGIIQKHVTRVNNIITDILGLSRRQSGQVERLALDDVVEGCANRWRESGNDPAQLRIDIPSDLPRVRFDARQLDQVVDNLLTNALRHGGSGPIDVSAGRHPQSGLPWLRIRDHGPGVSDEARNNLFEPFFTTSRDGTGLGLFLCRELCENNQARLDHEPAQPGASFVITFAHPDRVFQ